ncbi:DUF1931 family protein [Microbispora sp. NPDC049125]
MKPILEQLATLPPFDLSIGEETVGRLPEIVGGRQWHWLRPARSWIQT